MKEIEMLIASYDRQSTVYRQALLFADSLCDRLETGERIEDDVRHLSELMRQIDQEEASLVDAKRRWRESGAPITPRLQAVLDTAADLIRSLAQRIDTLLTLADASKSHLALQLDETIRQQKMRQAYSRRIR